MALTDDGGNNGMVMPVAPLNGGSGYGGFGGDWCSWIILFLIFGMFGMGGWGGFGGGFNGGLGFDFPWLLNGQKNTDTLVSAGFQNAQIASQLTGIQSAVTSGFGDMQLGIAGVNQNICQTGNSIVSAVTGVQSALSQQMYSNQLADLERSFAAQTANTQGLSNLSAQIANFCCENRAATQDVKYTIATEACANRAAGTANTQMILDKLCQLELDGYRRENDQLRSQLNFANLQASQVAQTAELRANNATVANQLVSELRSCPIPAQPVYGNQPIFTCSGNSGCGCGNSFVN